MTTKPLRDRYRKGTRVRVTLDDGTRIETRTDGDIHEVGGRRVVRVVGVAGLLDVERVRAIYRRRR